MPKGHPKQPVATRVNIYLHPEQMKVKKEIANYSAFVQIATDNAADIMAWAILRGIKPKRYHNMHELKDVIGEFNEKYPADPLTQKRLGTWHKNSPMLQEILS